MELATIEGMNEIAEEIAQKIRLFLQVERTGVGKYIVSGIPEDYVSHVARFLPKSSRQSIQKVASAVQAEIDEYINGILRVGAKPFRFGQTVQDVYNVSMQLKNLASSVDDLFTNVGEQLGTTLPETLRPLITAVFNWQQGQDMTDISNAMQQMGGGVLPAAGQLGTETVPGGIPTMPGVTYEVGGGAPMGFAAASKKSIPIKIAVDEEEVEGFEFIPEERRQEYFEEGLVDPTELSDAEKEDLVRSIESGEADVTVLDPDPETASQIFHDIVKDVEVKEEAEEKEEEVEEAEEGLPEAKEEKPLSDTDKAKLLNMQARVPLRPQYAKELPDWIRSIQHITLPVPTQIEIIEAIGEDRFRTLEDDIVDATEGTAERIDKLNKIMMRTPKTSEQYKRLEDESRSLKEQEIHEAVFVYDDFYHDMVLSIAGNVGGRRSRRGEGLLGVQEALQGWMDRWRPGWLPAYNVINTWANMGNLPPELEELQTRIEEWKSEAPETWTGIKADLPTSVKDKISEFLTVRVPENWDKETGEVTEYRDIRMPNPLWTEYRTSRYQPEEEFGGPYEYKEKKWSLPWEGIPSATPYTTPPETEDTIVTIPLEQLQKGERVAPELELDPFIQDFKNNMGEVEGIIKYLRRTKDIHPVEESEVENWAKIYVGHISNIEKEMGKSWDELMESGLATVNDRAYTSLLKRHIDLTSQLQDLWDEYADKAKLSEEFKEKVKGTPRVFPGAPTEEVVEEPLTRGETRPQSVSDLRAVNYRDLVNKTYNLLRNDPTFKPFFEYVLYAPGAKTKNPARQAWLQAEELLHQDSDFREAVAEGLGLKSDEEGTAGDKLLGAMNYLQKHVREVPSSEWKAPDKSIPPTHEQDKLTAQIVEVISELPGYEGFKGYLDTPERKQQVMSDFVTNPELQKQVAEAVGYTEEELKDRIKATWGEETLYGKMAYKIPIKLTTQKACSIPLIVL